MTVTDLNRFRSEISAFVKGLQSSKRVLITAPGTADGDSVGSQLALRTMIQGAFPESKVFIVNDEPLPERYLFLPAVEEVLTPETFSRKNEPAEFDLALIVDGGIDRAGRVREWFNSATHRVFIDHHVVSVDYPYTTRIVDPTACSTTELIYYMSQEAPFNTPVTKEFAQCIYLGLIFDTGFFRHSNTTPEAMELGAKLLRTGFNFTRVGERGMLERTYVSLQLMSDTLARAKMTSNNRIIWSTLSQAKMKEFGADQDDREGIIDQLFLTHGIEVAALFFDLGGGETKVSFRSCGNLNVAQFARSLTEHGGGHAKAAGANLEMDMEPAVEWVLEKLRKSLQ